MFEVTKDVCSTNNIINEHCEDVERILIVEDVISLSNHLKSAVEKRNEVLCDVALNESQAKELAIKHKYQLVIVDINLPDSSGNFIGWLIRHKMKIFIMTGSDNVNDRARLVKLPIVDYICKTDEKSLTRYICDAIDRFRKNIDSLVVICDDSKLSRRYIADILRNQNIPFIELSNGKEAFKCIMEHHLNVDLLISDFEMPNMDGLELTRRLRLKYTQLELPILILSGKSEAYDIANMLKVGANEYVKKPFGNEEFLARMNALLDHSRLHAQNKKLTTELHIAAMRDYLTGLYNRNYFNANFQQVISQVKRDGSSYAIIILDIDHFKQFNDNYGHDAGDLVLKEVSDVLTHSARPMDIVCRWGGEEFIILLPNSNLLGAANLAERIRTNVEKLKVVVSNEDNPISVNISGGVALGDSDDVEAVIKKADERLYIAKVSGRNQIVLAQ